MTQVKGESMISQRHIWISLLAAMFISAGCGSSQSDSTSKRGDGSSTTNDGNSDKSKDASKSESSGDSKAIDFELTVAPIVKDSCGTQICHGSGSSFGVFEGDADAVVKAGEKILERLASTNSNLVMPRSGFGMTLSSTKRKLLESFLAQHDVKGAVDSTGSENSSGDGTTTDPDQDSGYRPPTGEVQKLCVNVTAAEKTEAMTTSFAQMKVIASAACGGGGCHEGALPRGFVNVESQWLNDYARGIVTNLKNGAMPIGGKSISASNKAAMIAYICARKDL